jgi:riboflavin synthase
MFTGLIERTGRVVALRPVSSGPGESILRLTLDPGTPEFTTEIGDSVAVNGCCLTVVTNVAGTLAFDLSRETVEKTCFATIAANDEVNLERALALGDRLGGHMVSGHVDGAGMVQNISQSLSGWVVKVEVPRSLGRYIINKGSICIDGVSLTVNDLEDGAGMTTVSLTLIPKTVEVTTFKNMLAGQKVNIEVDMVGKYIERLQQPWSH